jgi:hypothetical protein
MKNTNAKNHKNTTVKFNLIISTIATVLFSSISNSAIMPAVELVEIEPTTQSNLYQEAQESLTLSFSQIIIDKNDDKEAIRNMLVSEKNSISLDTPLTLTKVSLASE